MSNNSIYIFKGLQILAWIIFVGLCIEAGGLMVNFFFHLYNPDILHLLYMKLDISKLLQTDNYLFYLVFSAILTIAILKARLFYIIILLLNKLDLSKPFTGIITKNIFQLSYITCTIGGISYLFRLFAKNKLQNYADQLDPFWESGQAFILMAAILYILGSIFKRGMELQNENELTI